MSVTEQEIVLRWLASSVASRFLAASMGRTAAWNMDMFARLSILEGAAGVSPGTWLREKSRGFASALDHFGPKLAASWTTTSDQGVYDKAISAAARSLRGTHSVDAYDLVQDLISGSAKSSGPANSRLFYAVGNALRKNENALTGGDLTPGNRLILGTIVRWVTRAARDVYKARHVKHEVPYGKMPGQERGFDPLRTQGAPELDDEERTNLLLLALQSPGGPGNEVRRIIDKEIDRSFTRTNRPIVRAFLEKISQPKYRSPQQMKRLVGRFVPAKWFTQAYNLVRKEMMQELNLSPQQITNALGGNASKVFKFMGERVGRNARIRKILEELAEEIELLEPGISRVAEDEEAKPDLVHAVMRKWLEDKEREANLSSGNAFAGLDESFEMNEHKEWGEETGPFAEYRRGPSPLKVAAAWMEARSR
jgi:hypothetical protein